MIIWLLALVLFASLAFAGYSLGAVRAAASLLGLIVGAFLAVPMGHFFNPLLGLFGVKNPFLIWLLGPFIAFIVVLVVFKVIGYLVNSKVEVYYKYKASETLSGLYKRLSGRLGLCLGIANAAVYLVLISWVIYVLSYPTSQMVTGESVPFTLNLLNNAGSSLQSSGMAKITAAIDSTPESYYQTADIIGLIYHNDLLESRLTGYPAFLSLGERPEFQEIGKDKGFAELRQKQPPIFEIINQEQVQGILGNPELLNQIWDRVQPNLIDLKNYLTTGKSSKYDAETILGHWNFNLVGALNYLKRTKPNIGAQEMQRTRYAMNLVFGKTTFLATPEPEKLAIIKDLGKLIPGKDAKHPPTVERGTFSGTWSGENGKYQLTFSDKNLANIEAIVEGDQLTVTGYTFPIIFERE